MPVPSLQGLPFPPQIAVLNEEKERLKEEKETLVERVEVLEAGGDIGTQSSRNKDLRKQVDALQDELYKAESGKRVSGRASRPRGPEALCILTTLAFSLRQRGTSTRPT